MNVTSLPMRTRYFPFRNASITWRPASAGLVIFGSLAEASFSFGTSTPEFAAMPVPTSPGNTTVTARVVPRVSA